MLQLPNFVSKTKRAKFLSSLTLIMGCLLMGSVNAGPLQNKVSSLTYHQELSAFLGDTTFVYHDANLGTFVAYLSARSRLHVWYRNSATVLSGRWGASTQSAQGPGATMLCLNVGNALPRLSGVALVATLVGDTPCYSLLSFSHGVHHTLQGDPYGLARARNAPASIPDARRYSAQALMQLAGGDAASLRDVDLSP